MHRKRSQKVIVQLFDDNSPELLYSQLLTEYASIFVLKQLQLAKKVSCCTENDEGWVADTSEGPRKVDPFTCECIFNKSMLLLCQHILALCEKIGEPLYNLSTCDQRWKIAYYKSTQRIFFSSQSVPTCLVTRASKQHAWKLSEHQKFRQASIVTAKLASVASAASSIHLSIEWNC